MGDSSNVKKYPFIVSFYSGEKMGEKDYYIAFAPDLPGCITCGEEISINDNLVSDCEDALKCWIEAFKESNNNASTPDIEFNKIPEPSEITTVKRRALAENSFVIPIALN